MTNSPRIDRPQQTNKKQPLGLVWQVNRVDSEALSDKNNSKAMIPAPRDPVLLLEKISNLEQNCDSLQRCIESILAAQIHRSQTSALDQVERDLKIERERAAALEEELNSNRILDESLKANNEEIEFKENQLKDELQYISIEYEKLLKYCEAVTFERDDLYRKFRDYTFEKDLEIRTLHEDMLELQENKRSLLKRCSFLEDQNLAFEQLRDAWTQEQGKMELERSQLELEAREEVQRLRALCDELEVEREKLDQEHKEAQKAKELLQAQLHQRGSEAQESMVELNEHKAEFECRLKEQDQMHREISGHLQLLAKVMS